MRRPKDVKWLPAPRGVGDAADMMFYVFVVMMGEAMRCDKNIIQWVVDPLRVAGRPLSRMMAGWGQ